MTKTIQSGKVNLLRKEIASLLNENCPFRRSEIPYEVKILSEVLLDEKFLKYLAKGNVSLSATIVATKNRKGVNSFKVEATKHDGICRDVSRYVTKLVRNIDGVEKLIKCMYSVLRLRPLMYKSGNEPMCKSCDDPMYKSRNDPMCKSCEAIERPKSHLELMYPNESRLGLFICVEGGRVREFVFGKIRARYNEV